jgi:hypothetical protein
MVYHFNIALFFEKAFLLLGTLFCSGNSFRSHHKFGMTTSEFCTALTTTFPNQRLDAVELLLSQPVSLNLLQNLKNHNKEIRV